MPENILEIRELSVTFATERGPVKAVRRATLDVPRGGIVGLVGESGCGKSSLASAIIRLMPENARISGQCISYNGRNMLALSEPELQALRGSEIAMVFQDPMTALNPVLTIGRQMMDIQYRSGGSKSEKKQRIVEMLARVGICDPRSRLECYPHEFSGGMLQRVCIAMALMAKPNLLIADEPTTALDVTLEAQIVHLLKDLQQTIGCAILCVSHHLGMISELCRHVVVMYAGEVVEEGGIRDIFHNARHPYTQRLLACDPANIKQTTRDLPTIAGEIPDLIDLPAGCIFRSRCHQAMDICVHQAPNRRQAGPEHFAACNLLDGN